MTSDSDRSSALLLRSLREVLTQVGRHIAVLRSLLERAVLLTEAERGALVEVTVDGDLHYRALSGYPPDGMRGEADRLAKEILGEARRSDRRWITTSRGGRWFACVPIRIGARIDAILYLESRGGGSFREDREPILTALCAIAAPALDAVRSGSELMRTLGAPEEGTEGGRQGESTESRPEVQAVPEDRQGGAGATESLPLEVGLPSLLALAEMRWLEEALRQHPHLTRSQVADLLKISERALYKKLRLYQIES